MAESKRTRKRSQTKQKRRPPGKSVESREQQLIHEAMKLAEEKIRDGTATSQILLHFLKAGSVSESLHREKVSNENQLLLAKVDAIESARRQDELYEEAIKAMREYSGHPILGDDDET